jgi:hypothetical protein
MRVVRDCSYVEKVLARLLAGLASVKREIVCRDALLIGANRVRATDAGHHPHA